MIHQGYLQINPSEAVEEVKNDGKKLAIISGWMLIEVIDVD